MKTDLESKNLYRDITEYVSKMYKNVNFRINELDSTKTIKFEISMNILHKNAIIEDRLEYMYDYNSKLDYCIDIIDRTIFNLMRDYFTTGNTYNSFERYYNYEV